MKDKVSVIIPIFNSGKYLSETLSDLLNQDYLFYEVLAVDDCSTDDSVEIIKSFMQRFKEKGIELVLVKREVNGGLCAAINSGIELSTGDFLCFPDSDDEISYNYISAMMKTLKENPSKKWVRCNYTIVIEAENREYDVFLPRKSFYKNDYFDFVSKFIPHNAWNMIVEKSYFHDCIGNKIYDSRLTQEWSLLIPLSFYSDYARCDEILYRYIIRENAMSSWQNKDIDSVIEHFNALQSLNFKLIKNLKYDDFEVLSTAEKALSIYYHLMRYKKYIQNKCFELSKKELDEMYKKTSDLINEKYISLINNPELFVRLVFDKLLEADKTDAVLKYEKYKSILKNEFIVIYDTPGEKLLTAVSLVFGEPTETISYSDYSLNKYRLFKKVCIIENSKLYQNLISSDAENKSDYFDYRDVRESIRGWAFCEVVG